MYVYKWLFVTKTVLSLNCSTCVTTVWGCAFLAQTKVFGKFTFRQGKIAHINFRCWCVILVCSSISSTITDGTVREGNFPKTKPKNCHRVIIFVNAPARSFRGWKGESKSPFVLGTFATKVPSLVKEKKIEQKMYVPKWLCLIVN